MGRDLTDALEGKLSSVGSISAHSRPVECLTGIAHSETSVTLVTADTMGVIKVWKLEKEAGPNARWRSDLQDTLDYHRTRVTEILYGAGQIWTGKFENGSFYLASLIGPAFSFLRRDGPNHSLSS